jgi:hypothetical protein
MTHVNSTSDILSKCSEWYERLTRSPQWDFANLSTLQGDLASDGAYVIWLRLEGGTRPLCLKIGKAQRARRGLYSRLYEHYGSREHPSPNVLALHLMRDSELAKRTGLNLIARLQRQRLLKDWCTFQAQPFGFTMAPREVAILECFLTVKLLPRYVGRCGEYPPLPDPEGKADTV